MTTPNTIVVSVPHCGTRFVKERLVIKDHVHTTHEWNSLVRRVEKYDHVIVPLRKPDSVWRSWCRRNDSRNFPYAEYYLAWGALQRIADKFNIDVICVDKQDDPRITEWRAVGDTDNSRARWELIKIDQRAMFKLPIVNEYYGPYTG